jgi:hypothetical protein
LIARLGFRTTVFLPLVASAQVRQSVIPLPIERGKTSTGPFFLPIYLWCLVIVIRAEKHGNRCGVRQKPVGSWGRPLERSGRCARSECCCDPKVSRRPNQDCSIQGYEEFFRGAIPGFSQPVIIAAYTIEGCGGGNNWGRAVSVFYSAGGSVREFKQPSPGVRGPDIGDKHGVTVSGDRLTVRYSDYGPNDAHCCPSLHKTATFRLVNGAIIPSR